MSTIEFNTYITDAEWEVMRVVWANDRVTSKKIISVLKEKIRLFRLGVVFFTRFVPLTMPSVSPAGDFVPLTTLPVPPTTLPVPSTTFPVPSTGQFIATPRSAARIRPNAASIRRRSEPI